MTRQIWCAILLAAVTTDGAGVSAQAAQSQPAMGQGYYDGFGPGGPARAVVREWLHDTIVACDRPEDHGAKTCRLDGVASNVSIEYVGPSSDPQKTAVAFVSYSPDTGNLFHGVVGLWNRTEGIYTGGRFAISDDPPSGNLQEVGGVISYEAEGSRFSTVAEPAFRFRARLNDDGRRLRIVRVGPNRISRGDTPITLPTSKVVPITADVDTRGADEPVRRLLKLGDETEAIFYPRPRQPDRMGEFLDRNLIEAWNAALPAMRAEPLLDGNPLTGTQDTRDLRLVSLALGYHEGREATILATVRANVGGEERIFPIDFTMFDGIDGWRIGNIKPGEHGAPLFMTLKDIADRWERDHEKAPAPSSSGVNLADAGMSLSEPRYRGEWGVTFNHNGSEMAAFPRAGLVAYVKPKASLVATVRPGDVLYRGSLATPNVSGTAYVYKAGCTPAAYHVEGKWTRPSAIDFGFTLRGRSPIRDRNGCGVVGSSNTSPNAVLRFDSVLDTNG